MTNIIYCVDKPCNTSSIAAVCRLATDMCHIRNSACVPVFKEPLMYISNAAGDNINEVRKMTDEDIKIYIPRPTNLTDNGDETDEVKVYSSDKPEQSAQLP